MKKHTKIFIETYGYGEQDIIPCALCGKQAVDIHHIKWKSRGGTDEIQNLIALCRNCHEKAHNNEFTEDYLKLNRRNRI